MEEAKEKKILFDLFPPVSTDDWEDKIIKDLKGADYQKKLVWKTNEGFEVQPYYRSEDLEKTQYAKSSPGQAPYLRGNRAEGNDWFIHQDIKVKDIDEANKEALEILNKGVNSLGFVFEEKCIANQEDFDRLVRGIFLDSTKISFKSGSESPDYMVMLKNNVEKRKFTTKDIQGADDFDIILPLTIGKGFYNNDVDKAFERCKKTLDFAVENLPAFKAITVHGNIFHNAGANVVQELAYTISNASEYISRLADMGANAEKIANSMQFVFSVGSNYFFEIAKLRAARVLWSRIQEAYGIEEANISAMSIQAETSLWNKTIYDPYVNMLRSTTETMSAAIAGADSINTQPFNNIFTEPDKFAKRIARNVQLLLKEESYFNKVADPAGGSYYIETLTQNFIDMAWEEFLKLEDMGGYIEAFKKGYIYSEIDKTAQKRNNDLATRKEILLGTNEFPNFSEQMLDKISFKSEQEKGEFLSLKRGAEEFEKLRLVTEKADKNPKAWMFTFGNLAMRRARSNFACNFFACAGFEVVDNIGFENISEGIEAFRKSNSNIVVLCSSDEEYEQFALEVFEELKNEAIVVLAGYPKTLIEQLNAKGFTNFIHVKSNVLETLKLFQKELGIS